MLEPAALVDLVYKALFFLIIIRAVLSWIPDLGTRFPALVTAVSQITSPILDPIRRLMPPIGGLDLSPLVAVLLLALARDLLKTALSMMLP
ncbi:MAG: YggT family protein [Armatimonadota bacterium]